MKDIIKHLKRITNNKQNKREILKSAEFRDGHITVTDSHRLIRYKTPLANETHLIDLNTFKPLDGDYPNTDRLIYNKDAITVYLNGLNISVLKAYKKDKHFSMQSVNSQLIIKNENKETIGSYTATDNLTLEPYYFNPIYLIEMFEALKEFDDTAFTINFDFNRQSITPLQFQNDDIIYIITPIRLIP